MMKYILTLLVSLSISGCGLLPDKLKKNIAILPHPLELTEGYVMNLDCKNLDGLWSKATTYRHYDMIEARESANNLRGNVGFATMMAGGNAAAAMSRVDTSSSADYAYGSYAEVIQWTEREYLEKECGSISELKNRNKYKDILLVW